MPVPELTADGVLLRVRAASICNATDNHIVWAEDPTSVWPNKPYPSLLGHECVGEVVEVGAHAGPFRPGDWLAFWGLDSGAFAEYVVATESMCHPMPAGMPFEEGAMLEPFCVGLHAVRRADLRMGETVAIFGVGTIGMMTLIAARCSGPGWTVVTDPSAAKRNLALRCGADVALDPTREDPLATILTATGGMGVDVVFVAAAAPGVLEQAVKVCRRMGRLVIIASFFTGGGVEARFVQQRELAVLGTSMYTGVDYRLAIRLWEQGRLDPLPSLVSERIRLDQAPEAVAALAAGKLPDNIKTIIRFGDEPRA